MEFLKKYMFAITAPISLYFWFVFSQGFLNLYPCIVLTAVATLLFTCEQQTAVIGSIVSPEGESSEILVGKYRSPTNLGRLYRGT